MSYSEPQDKLGIRSAPTYTVYLDDVVLPHDAVVGTEGRGGNIALTALNRARVDVAAMANGIALRAWELGRSYAAERKQFDTPSPNSRRFSCYWVHATRNSSPPASPRTGRRT